MAKHKDKPERGTRHAQELKVGVQAPIQLQTRKFIKPWVLIYIYTIIDCGKNKQKLMASEVNLVSETASVSESILRLGFLYMERLLNHNRLGAFD